MPASFAVAGAAETDIEIHPVDRQAVAEEDPVARFPRMPATASEHLELAYFRTLWIFTRGGFVIIETEIIRILC